MLGFWPSLESPWPQSGRSPRRTSAKRLSGLTFLRLGAIQLRLKMEVIRMLHSDGSVILTNGMNIGSFADGHLAIDFKLGAEKWQYDLVVDKIVDAYKCIFPENMIGCPAFNGNIRRNAEGFADIDGNFWVVFHKKSISISTKFIATPDQCKSFVGAIDGACQAIASSAGRFVQNNDQSTRN